METETIKRVQAPQPEPNTFGKCFITSRNPIVVPANAPKESFDKYGFFKYQPLKQFEPSIDLYPIQKNTKSSNALFFQTSNKIDVFITKNGIDGIVSEGTIKILVEQAKTASKTAVNTYYRENYIFLEKTSSNKLLFIEKGETKVHQFTYNGVNYQHISLPIFVLGGNYDYKHEHETLYFLRSASELGNYIENNDNDNSYTNLNPNFILPEDIKNFIVNNPSQVRLQGLAYPFYNNLESNHRMAPKAKFSIKSGFQGYDLEEIFDSNKGAFKLDFIKNSEEGIEYEVNYSFINPLNNQPLPEIFRISGVLKVYGSGKAMMSTARVNGGGGSSLLNLAWRGVVLPANLSDTTKKEIFNSIASFETKPAGCPPKLDDDLGDNA